MYTTVTHLISSKYRLRSKTRSSRKSRRILFRGFFTLYPKRKTRRFSLRHFDQTLRYFDQTPSFPFCTTLKTENSEMKTSEFSLRACSHEPGTVDYPGVMIAPGQALPRVHMIICCPGATLPRVNFTAPGQLHCPGASSS